MNETQALVVIVPARVLQALDGQSGRTSSMEAYNTNSRGCGAVPGTTMSDVMSGKDADPLTKASEKVEDVASSAARAAKEKAAQLQPGGSQVGDVSGFAGYALNTDISCRTKATHAYLQWAKPSASSPPDLQLPSHCGRLDAGGAGEERWYRKESGEALKTGCSGPWKRD
jgi:hypothetical protein